MAYKPYDLAALASELARDEGRRNTMYPDSVGIPTVGIGRNMNRPVSDAIIDAMLAEDIDLAEQILDKIEPRWRIISRKPRQRALLNMAFNLGETRLRAFRQMWRAIGNALIAGEDETWWGEAAREALDSQWAKQVGARATRIAKTLETGVAV